MFRHREILAPGVKDKWRKLKATISREQAQRATVVIGEFAAEDMLDFSGYSKNEIDRIYVKFRDGMPLAAGIRNKIPHVDVRYIISQFKQENIPRKTPISFWEEYDGYTNDTIWFADPINASGRTAYESLTFLRKHFIFDTALLSHVVANVQGIKFMQTKLNEFNTESYMNYAHLSTKFEPRTGYLSDGLDLIPDFGDKIMGTLGADYSLYDLKNDLMSLIGTEAGEIELIKGTILHIIQLGNSTKYSSDRHKTWTTENWIYQTLRWYSELGELPISRVDLERLRIVLTEIYWRDFVSIEERPYKNSNANIYSLTEDGYNYVSKVYIPFLQEFNIPKIISKHYDYLIYLRPNEIENNIKDALSDE